MLAESRLVLRPASRVDAQRIVALVDAMADQDGMPHLDPEAQQRLIRDAFEKKRFEMVLAEWDGKPVGYTAFFEGYSTFEARPTLFIDDLFVQAEYRGRHVGYELFRHCLREAQRRDCGRMEWQVLEQNRPAFGFYDRLQAKKLQGWTHFRLSRADIDRMA